MPDYPKISIVTCTFNRVAYIEETIRSVLDQNYPNLEYILIDGGSTDGTVEIIKKYEANLAYWVSEPDQGMYHAIQKGFEKSTGEIMAWINSDDKYFPGSFRTVAQIFSNLPTVEWIAGIPTMYNNEGECVKVSPRRDWTPSRLLTGNYKWIQQESIFWKRSLWERAGGCLNTKYSYAGDFELWCRFFNYTKLYNVETTLSGFRLHGSQISVIESVEYEEEVKEIIKTVLLKNKCDFITKLSILCKKQSTKLLYYLAKKINLVSDKMLQSKHQIEYNFEKNKWEL